MQINPKFSHSILYFAPDISAVKLGKLWNIYLTFWISVDILINKTHHKKELIAFEMKYNVKIEKEWIWE